MSGNQPIASGGGDRPRRRPRTEMTAEQAMRGQEVPLACRIPRIGQQAGRRRAKHRLEPRSLPSRRRDRVAYALGRLASLAAKAEAQLLAVHRGQPAGARCEAHATPGAVRVAPLARSR